MEQNIGNAITIMLVGMATVFLILSLVVVIGNVIIRTTNRYFPGADSVKLRKSEVEDNSATGKIAAIVAAVDVVTHGKGQITKITKV